MLRDLTALTKDTSLKQAARVFSMMRISGLPVVDDAQRVIGFLSESNVIEAIVPRSRDMSGIFMTDFGEIARKMSHAGGHSVGDYMTEHAITVDEDQDLTSVAELMLSEGVKILPVVRDGALIGTVNRAEICSALMDERGGS